MSDNIASDDRVDALGSLQEFMKGYKGKPKDRASAEPVLLGEILRTEMAKLLAWNMPETNE